jgi:hypothetical protein
MNYPAGVSVDDNGVLHIDVPAILKHFNVPDTPQAREHATEMMREILQEMLPKAKVEVAE